MKKYLIDDTKAFEVYTETIVSIDQVLQEFSETITNPNLKDALYLPDQNELGQYKDGITTFVVEAEEKICAFIHENNYETCKDLISALTQMVTRAKEILNKDTNIEIVNDDSKLSLS